jgi:hypothetical protein
LDGERDEEIECDAVVFAVGISAAQRLLSACPPLAAAPINAGVHYAVVTVSRCVSFAASAMVRDSCLRHLRLNERFSRGGVWGTYRDIPQLSKQAFAFDLSA